MMLAWINQPSTKQPYHRFHGRNIWYDEIRNVACFIDEPISMPVRRSSVSPGWKDQNKSGSHLEKKGKSMKREDVEVGGLYKYPALDTIYECTGMTSKGSPIMISIEPNDNGRHQEFVVSEPYSPLEEVRKKIKVKFWVNVYSDGKSGTRLSIVYTTRELADAYATTARIACICVEKEVTEGEGL